MGGSRPVLDDVDVHSVASLLKSYLCDLPQPIIPVKQYDRVMHIVTRERPLDEEAAVTALSDAIQQLPCINYNLLRYLCEFLRIVARFSDVNRMTASNLARMFSPCFIKPEIDDPALLAGTAINRTTAVHDMIEHYSRIFAASCDSKRDSQIPSLVTDVTDGADRQEPHCLLNGTVSQVPPDILMTAGHSVDNVEENTGGSDLVELESSAVPQPQVSANIATPVTEIGREQQLKIVKLQQQLQAERCCAHELRQQLLAQRLEAARQAELLAKKLDEERTATCNAVMRVVELQTKLHEYCVKYGPLD